MFKSKLEGEKAQPHACLKRWFLVDGKNSLQGIRAGRQSFGNISVSSVWISVRADRLRWDTDQEEQLTFWYQFLLRMKMISGLDSARPTTWGKSGKKFYTGGVLV